MNEILEILKKSILAGIMIAIGGIIYLSLENKIIGAFMFGMGLFSIVNLKLNLFTGKIGYINKENYKEILIILLGNFIGTNIVAFLINQTRIAELLATKATPIVMTKINDNHISLLILSIFCGMLMFLAVDMFKTQPNIIGIIFVFLCVAVFILSGFEHCVANMFYFSLILNPLQYWSQLLIMILGNSLGAIFLNKMTIKKN